MRGLGVDVRQLLDDPHEQTHGRALRLPKNEELLGGADRVGAPVR